MSELPVALNVRSEVSALTATLRTVTPLAHGRLAIFSGVRLTADVGKLRIDATNGDQYISTAVAADVIEPGQIVVPAKPLEAFLRTCVGAGELTYANEMLSATCGRATLSLHTLSNSDWPMFPGGGSEWVDLTPHWPGIRRVLHAAATEKETTIEYQSIRFDPDGAACFDRYRCAAYLFETGAEGVSLPAALFDRAVRVLDPTKIELCVDNDKRVAMFRSGETFLAGALIAAQDYPDWRKGFRSKPAITLTVNREEILAALGRMKILAEDSGYKRVTFTRDGDSLILTATGPDVGTIHDEIPCYGDFDAAAEYEIAYAVDMATNHTGEEITFDMEGPAQAVQVVDGDWRAVMMPVVRSRPTVSTS